MTPPGGCGTDARLRHPLLLPVVSYITDGVHTSQGCMIKATQCRQTTGQTCNLALINSSA